MAVTVYAITVGAGALFLAGVFVERKIIRGRAAERCRACPSDLCLIRHLNDQRRADGDTAP